MSMIQSIQPTINFYWQDSALKALSEFISLPAKSPAFDTQWEAHEFLKKACQNAAKWGQQLFPYGHFEILEEKGKTPCLFFDIEAFGKASDKTVLFYGHLDKQPEACGWTKNRAPFKPVIENDRLYGRGSADDGYSVYSALSAIKALEENNLSHPRCCGLIETCEESGSFDLAYWLNKIAHKCAPVGLITVLDSTAGDYERLWLTTSFRGNIVATFRVKVLNHGIHSGAASGIVPESFTIARELLSRLENSTTGEVLPSSFHCEIPPERLVQLKKTAEILKGAIKTNFPWAGATQARFNSTFENLLAQTWKPQLAVIGAEGLPSLAEAGNVLRSETALRLSIRIPSHVNPDLALKELTLLLTQNVPYQAQVTVENAHAASGWDSTPDQNWFKTAITHVGESIFSKEVAYLSEGASIPILGLFSSTFPTAQFFITGVLGPASNAHGPDEMLNLSYVKKLTCAVAEVIHSMP